VAYVASVLRRTRHNGFPVVHGGGPDPERDEGEFDALGGGASRSGPLEGVILRSQLLVLLGSQARPGGQGRVGQGRIILTLPATLWSAVRATRGAAAHGASRARRAGRPRRVHLSRIMPPGVCGSRSRCVTGCPALKTGARVQAFCDEAGAPLSQEQAGQRLGRELELDRKMRMFFRHRHSQPCGPLGRAPFTCVRLHAVSRIVQVTHLLTPPPTNAGAGPPCWHR